MTRSEDAADRLAEEQPVATARRGLGAWSLVVQSLPWAFVAGALIGVLIPTIVLLYGVNIKITGSLSLVVSLPTMLVAFARYSRDSSFQVLNANQWFVLVMAAGSVTGTLIGGLLLGVVPAAVLIPLLVALLLASSVKVWRHQ